MGSTLGAVGPARPRLGDVWSQVRISRKGLLALGSRPRKTEERFRAAASGEPRCRARSCHYRIIGEDREIALTPRKSLRRGRGKNADMRIDELQVYRRHASSGGRGSALTPGLPQASLSRLTAKTDPPRFPS